MKLPIMSLLLAGVVLTGCQSVPFRPCHADPERQEQRSQELQAIVKADQEGRAPPVDWQRLLPKDEGRRKRVGEIFGEGCFKTAEDYAAAALVYQHGDVPDHFFQTYLWAKQAVELGDSSQKRLMAMGIDRYLVNTGHRQLFATQASAPTMDSCYCLEEVEESFPQERRKSYMGKSVRDALTWVDSLNEGKAACGPAQLCKKNLKPTPKGTVPGFW
ncbi:MAG: hypothetical protein AB7G93_10850 [Bdellovibrionales bacterium]